MRLMAALPEMSEEVFLYVKCRLCFHPIQGARVERTNGRRRFRLITWTLGLQCRGQGRFYRDGPALTFGREDEFHRGRYLFEGCFKRHCCVCALGQGWSPISFDEKACYICRDLIMGVLAKAFVFVRGAMHGPKSLRRLPGCLVVSIVELYVLHPTLCERVRRMYGRQWYSSPVLQRQLVEFGLIANVSDM